MMFHVEQNTKDLHCRPKINTEKFKVYLDENKIIGKTIPFPKKEEMSKYYKSEEYYPHSLNKKIYLVYFIQKPENICNAKNLHG